MCAFPNGHAAGTRAVAARCGVFLVMAGGCAPLPNDDCESLHNCPEIDASASLDAEGVDAGLADARSAWPVDAMGGTAPDAIDAPSCDPTMSPHDAPCVIDERFGIFVSATGTDTGAGTRASPMGTLAHGLDAAKSSGKLRVYACAGAFDESLVLGAARDGVSVFGGLDCATWSYSEQNRVIVAPSISGYALDLEALTLGAAFEDVEFDAPNAIASSPGQSSIAVFVSASQNVRFARVLIIAGNATDGAPGATAGPNPDGGPGVNPTNWAGTPPAYADLNGNDATSVGGGPSKMRACPDGTVSVGGQGGGSVDGGASLPGAGSPAYDDAGGVGGANGKICVAGIGGQGSDAPGSANRGTTSSLGNLGPTGWAPAAGALGANGEPGQGGGGGGNGPAGQGGGGSGACGGCGGAGGWAGTAGGSSIAILSYSSSVALVGCTLTARTAGWGGAGGGGEAGQAGSLVEGNGIQSGCPGGAGGSGAGGGGGQGGPGGLSVGIAFAGTAPTFDGAPVATGMPLARVSFGAGGAGGHPGPGGPAATSNIGQPQPGAEGAAGIPGAAQAVLGL